jgi:type II secretory pathway component PulK
VALLVVLWAIVLAAIIVAAVQASSYGMAMSGRESLARTRAYWAARAGVEAMIAKIEANTLEPSASDAFRIYDDCVSVAEGSFEGASYRVTHTGPRGEVLGPVDEGSRLNLNALTPEQFLNVTPIIGEDVIAGVLDWVDPDDETLPLGAEITAYQSLPHPYEPRNAPMRSVQEMEMMLGATTIEVRGEDWNQNNILDPNEDDGDASWPPDNADGRLDAGWSGPLTASTVEGGLTPSGQEPLDLSASAQADIEKRTGAETDQARAILAYVQGNPQASMRDFILNDLNRLEDAVNPALTNRNRSRTRALTDEQLGKLLDECVIGATRAVSRPGKLNVNTATAETLEMLPEMDSGLADAILSERDSTGKGLTSIIQVKSAPGMTRRQFANVYELLTVRSNVFTITSRGRDDRTGIEVEIVATVDRSVTPIIVQEIRVQ